MVLCLSNSKNQMFFYLSESFLFLWGYLFLWYLERLECPSLQDFAHRAFQENILCIFEVCVLSVLKVRLCLLVSLVLLSYTCQLRAIHCVFIFSFLLSSNLVHRFYFHIRHLCPCKYTETAVFQDIVRDGPRVNDNLFFLCPMIVIAIIIILNLLIFFWRFKRILSIGLKHGHFDK